MNKNQITGFGVTQVIVDQQKLHITNFLCTRETVSLLLLKNTFIILSSIQNERITLNILQSLIIRPVF
jgi:hypothetical protein